MPDPAISPAYHSISAAAGCIRPTATHSPTWPTRRPPARPQQRGLGQAAKRRRCARPTHPAQAWEAYEAFGERIRARPAAERPRRRRMAPDDPGRPFVDAFSGFMNGAETDRLSVADFLAYDDAASSTNWRLARRLRCLHRRARCRPAGGLGTRVTAIAAGRSIRLDTDRGTIEARAAIVAVSTAVLASGAIRFDPAADESSPRRLAPARSASPTKSSSRSPSREPYRRKATCSAASTASAPAATTCGRSAVRSSNVSSAASSPANSRPRAKSPPSPSSPISSVTCSAPTSPAASRRSRSPPGGASRPSSAPTATPSPDQPTPGAVLARPVSPRLCFAGEACSPRDFYRPRRLGDRHRGGGPYGGRALSGSRPRVTFATGNPAIPCP